MTSYFVWLHLYSQWTWNVSTVTGPTLAIINPAHMHNSVKHSPTQQPIGEWWHEAGVGRQRVRSEDIWVNRVRGHS